MEGSKSVNCVLTFLARCDRICPLLRKGVSKMYQRTYRLPSGELTTSPDAYADAWEKIGKGLEEIFEGYVYVSVDPTITLELRLVDSNNVYRVMDRVTLSVGAANLILEKFQKAH